MFCRRLGDRRRELTMGKVVSQEDLLHLTSRLKREGRSVVFTNGCFDIIHPGHVRCLAEARALGDLLVVAVNSDASVRKLKGPTRPLNPEQDRAEVLAGLAAVDYVTVFDEATPREIIARILPNILVKGADYSIADIVGREEVESAGGQVVSIPLAPGYSTTALVQRICESVEASKSTSAKQNT